MDDVGDYKDAVDAGLPDEDIRDKRADIYDDWKAVAGLADPKSSKLESKNVGGLLKWVFGKNSPKHGAFQRRVVGTNVDLSGRAVISPNSSLDLDQVGLPEDQAWELYGPFITRKLSMAGYDPTEAVKMTAERHPAAAEYLRSVVKERPIMITRAPALHKYSVLAMWPQLTKGRTLQLPPAIVHPFNADYDGDTMSMYVPVSKAAVKEAVDKMMPTSNLLSARDFTAHYKPEEEYQLGVYLASRRGKGKAVRRFATPAEAVSAYRKGLVKVDENVVVDPSLKKSD
jgi:DNA-directed RNA polymerase subunit beta'